MTDYKNIKGKRIKFFTNDLDNTQSEGQLFFQDTVREMKSIVSSAAWSSTAALITATGFGTHSGPNSNSFYVGGLPVIATTQHYNGTGWTLGGNYPSSRYGLASAGTQTAGLAFGGEDGSDNKTNVSAAYDGSSWTAGPNINSARGQTSGTGTQTSALLAGGRGPGGAAMVTSFEEWNGTSWANLTAISQARGQHFMSGPETATFIAGGGTGNNAGSPITNLTEEFDGSSLSSGGNLNTARAQGGSSGNSGDGLVWAGASNEKNTEQYNGTSWTETSDLASTHRGCGNGAGSISNSKGGICAGAYPAVSTSEEWNITALTVTGAAWASGGNMNTARRLVAGCGLQTAGLVFGGYTTTHVNNTEEYNGSSWTAGGNLPAPTYEWSGNGTQTAALGAGGIPVSSDTSVEYNGSSWSEGGTMNTARRQTGSFGTQTAAVLVGGTTPNRNEVEEYNGSSWTSVTSIPNGRQQLSGIGLESAGLAICGGNPAIPNVGVLTEEYDGTNWTTGGNALVPTSNLASGGTQTAALKFGGYTALQSTEHYDGSSWVTSANLATGRHELGGAGTQPAGIAFAGRPPGNYTNATEEFTAETTALNLKTITDS